MNLEMIAGKLATDGVGVTGTSIFINHMPVSADSGVLLRPPYVGTPIDYELPNYRRTTFAASIRGKTYVAAKTLAAQVVASLTFHETVLAGLDIRHVRPVTEPVSFPISEGGHVEFLVIFEAIYVIVT